MVNDLVDQGQPDKKNLFKSQNKSADKEFKKKRIYLLVSRFASKLMFISKIKKILKLPHGPVIYNFRIEIILCQKKSLDAQSELPVAHVQQLLYLLKPFVKIAEVRLSQIKNNGVIHIVTVLGVSVKKLITHMCVQFLVSKQFRIRVKHAGLFVNVFKVAKSLY